MSGREHVTRDQTAPSDVDLPTSRPHALSGNQARTASRPRAGRCERHLRCCTHRGRRPTTRPTELRGRFTTERLRCQLVVKHLSLGFEREADVYELLWRHFGRPPAVRLLGREIAGGATYLYLEDAQPSALWPWSDTQRAGAVCRPLARLHDDGTLPYEVFLWDYEAYLARSARSTLELATDAPDARDACGQRLWRRVGDLRRVAAALPRIRRRLLAGATTVIHGDMHPGDVILRAADREVVLIDWARARGSNRRSKTSHRGCIRSAAGNRRRGAGTIR